MHRDTVIAICLSLFVAVGLFGGGVWYGYEKARGERQVVHEGKRPGQTLPGGAVLAPRDPGGVITLPEPELPPGSTPARSGEFEIDPGPVDVKPDPETGKCPAQVKCPTVRLRLDLVDHKDGTQGVVATVSPGEITRSIDVPRKEITRWREPAWAAGVEYEATTGDVALAVDREAGPFRVGVSVEIKSEEPEVRARAMWRF